MCRRTAPSIPSPGTPPSRSAPSCRQDEYLYILEGRLDFFLDGAEEFATAGDTVRLPMGKPHGIFNKTQQTAKTLFWVSPTRRLYDLFWAIHNMKQQNPDDVVKLAAEHNIHFLPPPPGA